ncbi:transmembrane protein, putative, partial [Bodo saltans]
EIADACDAAVWGTACVGAVALVSFVLIAGLRPFVVRAEFFSSLCVSLLAVVAGALMLASDVEASGVVSLLASVLGLLTFLAVLMWTVCLRGKKSDAHWNDNLMSKSGDERKKKIRGLESPVKFTRRPTARPSLFGVSAAYIETARKNVMISHEEHLATLLTCICEARRKSE